jgi:Ca2+-binding EF-hand superfamily protein
MQPRRTPAAIDERRFTPFPHMNTRSVFLVAAAALLPVLAFAAKDGKVRKKPGNTSGPSAMEALKPFDKDANHQIDAAEREILQKAFSAMREADKNHDGMIDETEVASLKSTAAVRTRERRGGGFAKADKNGNRKIDTDEVEQLEKAIAGSPFMTKLDKSGNGKLEADELDRVNQRLGSGRERKKTPSGATPPPEKAPATSPEKNPVSSAPEPVEKSKPEGQGASTDPFLPKP